MLPAQPPAAVYLVVEVVTAALSFDWLSTDMACNHITLFGGGLIWRATPLLTVYPPADCFLCNLQIQLPRRWQGSRL